MGSILYQHPTDNVARNGVLTVTSGTPDPAYPKENLVDGNPALPAKLLDPSGVFMWDFTTAQSLDVVALIHHNLMPGLNVRLQGNATNSWGGSPSYDVAFTIPAYRLDGYCVNPFIDLTTIPAARSFRYWRIYVQGTNTYNVAIGEVWLGQTRRVLTNNIQWGLHEFDEHPIVQHRTDFLVDTIYDYGVTQRHVAGAVNTDRTGEAALRAWWQAARGRAFPFLFALDAEVNDCILARFGNTKYDKQWDFLDDITVAVEFEEVSRGLTL